MRRALEPADRATRALARAPGLVFTWWVATLPLLLAASGLLRRALDHGLPAEAGSLLLLLLWSCLVVLAWAWYLLGTIFMHQQALAASRREPVPRVPSLRRLLDLLPSTATAHALRTGLSLVALIPLGAALPLVRITTAPWPVRASLAGARSGDTTWPELEVVLAQVLAWLLLGLVTTNIVVLAGWLTHGSLLDALTMLPQLSDPRLWVISGLLGLSLVEPWRALALIAALHLDQASPAATAGEASPC